MCLTRLHWLMMDLMYTNYTTRYKVNENSPLLLNVHLFAVRNLVFDSLLK